MKKTARLIQLELSRLLASCRYGMAQSHEVMLLVLLVTLLGVLLLDDPMADQWLLRLLAWLGRNCLWCAVAPA